jgi:cyclic pyranopterin phosphate synthase
MVPLPLHDLRDRRFETLRVSVTDRCNFRCRYCMPADGVEWFPREEILSFEEIRRVVAVGARIGLRRIRITGGEPLLRRDLDRLVSMLAGVEGVEDLGLTTNAALLPPLAVPLRRAGLRRLNISLDSLDRETFRQLTRQDILDRVLEGLDAACEMFDRVKVNAVLLRGFNDAEVPAFARLARERGIEVRFIEYMPLDAGSGWGPDKVIPGREAFERVAAVHELIPRVADRPAQTSQDYRFADGAPGAIGFVNPVTEPFCERCDRMRLTSDGKILNCMFDRGEVDVREVLRGGHGDDALEARLRESALAKGPGGLLELREADHYRDLRNMSRLGG